MSTVVFVNAYEFDYLGTRLLASWLLKNAISTHCILLDDNIASRVLSPQEKFIGYQYYTGYLFEHRAMHHPLREADWEALTRAISREQPRILGFSARSTNNFLIDPVVSVFKKAAPDALLVAGGYGPTLEPDLYLSGGFDVVVRGDGEEAILEIAQRLEQDDPVRMHRIANTSWSAAHGGHINPLRDQTKDLSLYPPPLSGDAHFSWIQDGQLHSYEDPTTHSSNYYTLFGRGCPGKCTYCSGGHWKSLYTNEGKKAYVRRNRDIEEVIEECRSLPDSVKTIVFCDEYWSLPKEKTEKFLTLYKQSVNKNFFAYFAYDQMLQHPELMDLAIDAGLDSTAIGFQTGSSDLLERCYARKPRYPVLLSYARRLFENFVTFSAQFIGGNCYESWEDLEQSYDVIRSLPVSLEYPEAVFLTIYRLRPHPESPIIKAWPRVVTDPMPAKEWYFRAILMQYCRFFTTEEFSSLIAPFAVRTSPPPARPDCVSLERKLHTMFLEKQLDHYRKLVQTPQTAPWVYYGAGDCYTKNREFFAALKPQALLLDKEYMPSVSHIDGIPVVPVEDFCADGANAKKYNFMVFLQRPQKIKRKLLRRYGVPFDKIHSCSRIL